MFAIWPKTAHSLHQVFVLFFRDECVCVSHVTKKHWAKILIENVMKLEEQLQKKYLLYSEHLWH